MSDQPQIRTISKRKYGIFYPEGSGFLHLEHVAVGTQGTVALVMSCADHEVYIRKRGELIDLSLEEYPVDYGSDEVFYYRPHKLIPRLMDWIIYRPVPRSHEQYFQYCSTTTIWEHCSYGDLRNLIDSYDLANNSEGNIREVFPYKHAIPEAFIWKIFGQLVQALSYFHHVQPAISHQDIFVGNVFLRPSDRDDLPECCLGDFGRAMLLEANAWNSQGLLRKRRTISRISNPALPVEQDYHAVILLVKQMMTLNYSFRSGESTTDTDCRIEKLFENLELVHTGQSADSPIPHDDRPLSTVFLDSHRDWFQSSRTDQLPRYTPLLFDTIRQFEKRVAATVDISNGPTREFGSNRDWTYLGKAMEKKAADRMEVPLHARYPPVDSVFDAMLESSDKAFSTDRLGQAVLCDRDEILTAINKGHPVGPFRIARLDRTTLAVTGVSENTYNTIDLENPSYRVVEVTEGSPPRDPLQMDNVPITADLNYSRLN